MTSGPCSRHCRGSSAPSLCCATTRTYPTTRSLTWSAVARPPCAPTPRTAYPRYATSSRPGSPDDALDRRACCSPLTETFAAHERDADPGVAQRVALTTAPAPRRSCQSSWLWQQPSCCLRDSRCTPSMSLGRRRRRRCPEPNRRPTPTVGPTPAVEGTNRHLATRKPHASSRHPGATWFDRVRLSPRSTVGPSRAYLGPVDPSLTQRTGGWCLSPTGIAGLVRGSYTCGHRFRLLLGLGFPAPAATSTGRPATSQPRTRLRPSWSRTPGSTPTPRRSGQTSPWPPATTSDLRDPDSRHGVEDRHHQVGH